MDWTIADLISFRDRFNPKEITINNTRWQYYDIGNKNSELTIVFLHGTTGSMEIFWLQMKALLNDYRILSLDIPLITGVEKIIIDIHEILTMHGIGDICLVGTSFGGYLAQKFSVKYGNMVKKLVLSNTFITTNLYHQKYKKILRIERLIPSFVIRRFMKRGLLTITHPSTRDYLVDQLQNNLSKKTLLARLKSFITEEVIVSASIDQVLIAETIKDPLVPHQLQENLKRAYPQAKVKTFQKEANHFPYLTTSDEYNNMLFDFLKS